MSYFRVYEHDGGEIIVRGQIIEFTVQVEEDRLIGLLLAKIREDDENSAFVRKVLESSLTYQEREHAWYIHKIGNDDFISLQGMFYIEKADRRQRLLNMVCNPSEFEVVNKNQVRFGVNCVFKPVLDNNANLIYNIIKLVDNSKELEKTFKETSKDNTKTIYSVLLDVLRRVPPLIKIDEKEFNFPVFLNFEGDYLELIFHETGLRELRNLSNLINIDYAAVRKFNERLFEKTGMKISIDKILIKLLQELKEGLRKALQEAIDAPSRYIRTIKLIKPAGETVG